MLRRLLITAIASVGIVSHAMAQEKGAIVELDGLKSAAPAAWKKQETNSSMRAFQFKVPKVEGDSEDAEVIVFFFGKGQGGSVDDNIKRWKGQFKDAPADKIKQEKFEVGKVPVTYLDIQGNYQARIPPADPNGKLIEKKDFRAINAIFGSPNGPYYIRILGPNKTVTAQKKAFDEWLKNFK